MKKRFISLILSAAMVFTILPPAFTAHAEENTNARYIMDAQVMPDGKIAVLFARGGTIDGGKVTGGTLWYGEYSPQNNCWDEQPAGEKAPVAKEAALALSGVEAHIAYITSDDKLAYISGTASGWSQETIVESNNCNDTQGELHSPDIAVGADGTVHLAYMDTQGAPDDYYKAADGMYATNENGEFVKSLIANGTGCYEPGEGGDRDTPSQPKVTFTDNGYNAVYFNSNSSRGSYGGWENWCTLQFVSASGKLSRDTKSGTRVMESIGNGANVYTLIYENENCLVLNGNADMDDTKKAFAASAADMTIDNSQIYYAAINDTSLMFYQNGSFVENITPQNSILNTYNKMSTVIADGIQYVIYTGADADKSLIIGSLSDAKFTEYLIPNTVYYDISLSNGITNGAIGVDKKNAAQDETVTITVLPDEDYELTAMTVTGENVNYTVGQGITKADDMTYTFTMPQCDVTIEPTFTPVPVVGTSLTYNSETKKIKLKSDTNLENAALLIAEYSNDSILVNITSETINLEAGASYTKEIASEYDIKVMLWDNLDSMKPLSDALEIKNTQSASLGGNGKGSVVLNISGTGSDNANVKYVDVSNTDEMKPIAVVDASLENSEALDGTAEIRIKYEPDKGFDATNLLPGYFNETTQEWETIPYMIDEENNEAIIITDHFSKYGLFEVEASGTPKAFAKPLDAARMCQMSPKTAEYILEKYNANNGVLDEKTVENILGSLDGMFNGKLVGTGGNTATIATAGGAIKEGFMANAGKQFAYLAVVGACLSAANNAYKYGVTDSKTLKEITKAGIGVGVAFFATPPVALAYVGISMAQMAYDQHVEKELTQKHNELNTIFKAYKKKRGERKLADWKKIIDQHYEKYYVNEINSTDNLEERYNKFYNSVQNVISGYAYEFMNDYVSGDLYEQYLNVPLYTADTAKIAEDLCYNYEAQINESLSALFLQYSRRAYSDAIKKFEAECEKERQELNKIITLHFYESGTTGKAKDYYVRFADEKSSWRAEFDNSGDATLKFTVLSYIQIGCPSSITVFDKDTNRAVGRINFPAGSLTPGETTDIAFDTSNVNMTIKIREAKRGLTEDYMFANCYGRLAPLSSDANFSDYSFKLDDSSQASMIFTLTQYYKDGAPNRVEIVDDEGYVIYQAPFNPAMSEIVLDGETCGLNIFCGDEESVAYYKDRKAEIVYFKSFDEPVVVKSGEIDETGKCTLMFSLNEYLFRKKDYTLWVYDKDNKKVEESYDLCKSYDKDVLINNVCLTYNSPEDDPEKEPLVLDNTYYQLEKGGSVNVKVISGKIIGAESDNTEIVTVSGKTIHAVDAGDTYVKFYGKDGSVVGVYIEVDGNYKPFEKYKFQGYNIYQYYEVNSNNFHDERETTWEIGERPSGDPEYVIFYTGLSGISRIEFWKLNAYTSYAVYLTDDDPNILYYYYFGDGGMNLPGYRKNIYIENPTRGGFKVIQKGTMGSKDRFETHTVYVPCE